MIGYSGSCSVFASDVLKQLAAFPVEGFYGLIAGHGKGMYIERGEAQTRLEKALDVGIDLRPRTACSRVHSDRTAVVPALLAETGLGKEAGAMIVRI